MKIALLHNLYGQSARGGAEKAVALMARDYLAAGQEVFLITTGPQSAISAPEKNAGLKIYYIKSDFYNLARFFLVRRALWQLGNIFAFRQYGEIKKILAAEKPDLVITHNLMGLGFLAPLAIRRLGLRHEHFLHDIQLLHPSGLMIFGREKMISGGSARIYQFLTRALLASPAKIISPSHWLLDLHRARGFFPSSATEIRRLRLANDRLSIGSVAEAKTETPADAINRRPAKNFLFVGQVETHKGIFLLLESFKKLAGADLKLVVIGDGEKLAAAKSAAPDDKRIEFRGRLDSVKVKKIMAESDCLIVPSLCYENSPTVIYEAQAAGLPVLAADLGGIPEIMSPRNILFRPGDEEDLLSKLTHLLI